MTLERFITVGRRTRTATGSTTISTERQEGLLDVVQYFNQESSIMENESVTLFDYNNNGRSTSPTSSGSSTTSNLFSFLPIDRGRNTFTPRSSLPNPWPTTI